jgi:hypothetical protein
MKALFFRKVAIGIILTLFIVLGQQKVYAQSVDSLTRSKPSQAALQFQLVGDLGIYYLGNFDSNSHFRIGADFSLNHSSQSGNENGYSIETYPPPSQTSTETTITKPDQTSNSYQISLSAVYLQELVEYKHSSLYAGIGPMISYSWNRSVNNSSNSQFYTYDTSIYTSNYENTTRTSGIGPFALIGIKSRLLDHISLSAEIGLSALYQWTTQTNSDVTIYSPPSTQRYNDGNISNLSGWTIAITNIRIGAVIDL